MMIDISGFDGVFQYASLNPRDIPFSDDVRKACEANACGMYGKRWTCPPGAGEVGELKNKILAYENALVFTHMGRIEDSFDFEGMQSVGKEADILLERVISALMKESISHLPLGHGACKICGECTYPDLPCRFPDRAITSVEACGINVVQLAADCKINYHNGADTVTYFCLILY